MIAGSTPPPDGGAHVPPYRRRRKGPWVAVVAVLAVAAATTWTLVLVDAGAPAAVACPPPVSGTLPGEVLAETALDDVAPVPPGEARVQVLNAGGQRGQANLVAAQLSDLGFPEAASPDNDPLYAEGDMECVGQLRFGAAGQGAARTLSFVLPCAELVRDDRTDDVVSVVVGTGFRDVQPPRAVRNALDQIGSGDGSDGSANADPADPGAARTATPAVDPTLLATARDAAC